MNLWKDGRRAYVTADTHFGDEVALRKFARPFPSVEAMDEAMVAAINERVGERDWLVHLGDFGGDLEWTKAERGYLAGLRQRIACRRIILVRGNLDPVGEPWFDGMFDDIHELLTWKGWPTPEGRPDPERPLRVVACHYPLRQWQGWPNGAEHVYGHVHGGLPEEGRSMDVGVDCWNFRPLDLAASLTMLAGPPFEPPQEWPRRQPSRPAP